MCVYTYPLTLLTLVVSHILASNHSNLQTRGLEAPDEMNIFSSSVEWIFEHSQCFVYIDSLKMATKCHEDGVQNTLLMVFARDCAPHHLQNFFLTTISFVLHLSVPWP